MVKPKKIEHIKERRDQGLTYRELGDEFGLSHTHIRRVLKKREKDEEDRNKENQ